MPIKRGFCLFLALLLCISLCACTKEESTNSPYEKYAEYEELFCYLEDGDYDNANAYIQNFFGVNDGASSSNTTVAIDGGLEPAQTTTTSAFSDPTYTTVEITADNWQDYFEVLVRPAIVKNGFGEFSELSVNTYVISKEGLTVCSCEITCEYAYDYKRTTYHVDLENDSVTFGDEPNETLEKVQKIENLYGFHLDGVYRVGVCALNQFNSPITGSIGMAYNFELLRIQGTLIIEN